MSTSSEIAGRQEERASALHEKIITINSLLTTPFSAFTPEYCMDLKRGGNTAVTINVSHPTSILPTFVGEPNFSRAIQDMYLWYGRFHEIGSDKISLISTAEDIIKAKNEGKVGVIFGFQGANQFEELGHVKILHQLGLRISGLGYMYGNLIGDGCREKRNSGLTNYGERVIEEMNKVGVVVDVSHSGYKTSMEAMELSQEPVIMSHSNPLNLAPGPGCRNASDEQLKTLAEKDGVIGISGIKWLLLSGVKDFEHKDPTMKVYMDHVDYVVNLIGADHVGIGTDLGMDELSREEGNLAKKRLAWRVPTLMESKWEPDPAPEKNWLHGVDSALGTVEFTKGLVARGYSDDEIEKIMGGNFLRLFKKVWKTSSYAPRPNHLASIHPMIPPPL